MKKDKDNNKYWLAFASMEKIGSVTVKTLYDRFGSIKSAWCAGADDLYRTESLTKRQVDDFLGERKNTDPDKCLEYIENRGIKFITFEDEEYPKLLKQIENPPMTLFYKGDLKRCNFERTLSVVGSRKASDGAKEVLSKIIGEFKNTDMCVVSGLALGIDTCAHLSALKSGLMTIGVIASGFDFVYPSSNAELYKKVENASGVIFSEYWPSFAPIQWRFPHRNRIVTGLSRGTLVAEAALKSGAMISANLCLEQNRELMCMPGMLTNPNTEGIYKLIKSGAAVVTRASDILEAMDWKFQISSSAMAESCEINLEGAEKAVFSMIARNSCNADRIANELDMDFGDLTVILTTLELGGYIKQTDGDKYISVIKNNI